MGESRLGWFWLSSQNQFHRPDAPTLGGQRDFGTGVENYFFQWGGLGGLYAGHNRDEHHLEGTWYDALVFRGEGMVSVHLLPFLFLCESW